jgi:hypothetical protein
LKSGCQGNAERSFSRRTYFAEAFGADRVDQAHDKRTLVTALVPYHGERARSLGSGQGAINNFVAPVRSRSHFRNQGHALSDPTSSCTVKSWALRVEVDEAAWSALYSTRSRPIVAPKTGKIAPKVINHYGDEVLKVYSGK